MSAKTYNFDLLFEYNVISLSTFQVDIIVKLIDTKSRRVIFTISKNGRPLSVICKNKNNVSTNPPYLITNLLYTIFSEANSYTIVNKIRNTIGRRDVDKIRDLVNIEYKVNNKTSVKIKESPNSQEFIQDIEKYSYYFYNRVLKKIYRPDVFYENTFLH